MGNKFSQGEQITSQGEQITSQGEQITSQFSEIDFDSELSNKIVMKSLCKVWEWNATRIGDIVVVGNISF